MNQHFEAQGIRFNDLVFTEPVRLTEWVPPKFPGVFVILTRDPNWAPKPFQPLWFGEFGNNAQHHLASAGKPPHADALFVSVLPMLFSTTDQRCAVRDRLVWAYNPTLQAKHTPAAPSEWVRKLHQLEKKHEEQATELRMLLTSVATMFEPQPPPSRRRRIGFLPDLEPSV